MVVVVVINCSSCGSCMSNSSNMYDCVICAIKQYDRGIGISDYSYNFITYKLIDLFRTLFHFTYYQRIRLGLSLYSQF